MKSISTMKRTAIAIAAVLPAIAGAQQANVTLYGIVDVTVRHATNSNAANGSLDSVGDGALTASRFGFRGSESLGNGMSAFFSLENGFDPSNAAMLQSTASANYGQGVATAGRLFGREALVGVSSAFGTITLGRQYTIAHSLSGRFQPQPNPNLDAISAFSTHHVARQDNMVRYANKFGPIELLGSYTFSEGNGKAWGVGAAYAQGPVDLVGYVQKMESFNGAETRNIYGIGGSYAINDDAKLFAGYMKRDHAVSAQKNDVYTAGINYNVTPSIVLTASYSEDRVNAFGTSASGKRQVSYLVADYLLSKRTDAYLEIDRNRVVGGYALPAFMGIKGAQTGITLGLRHRF